MGSRKFLGGLAAWFAVVVVAVVVAGCGAAGPAAPSSLDPARLAPAGSLVYVSLTVRPQGAQRTQVEAALHKLFGAHADASIRQAMNKLFRKAGTSYNGGAQKWLGQRIGFVVTGFNPSASTPSSAVSQDDLALIAPTSDVSDARRFVERALKRSPNAAGGIIGHYAVFGGVSAFKAVGAVAAGAKPLSSSVGYRSAVAGVPSNAVGTAYVNLRGYFQALGHSSLGSAMAPLLKQEFGGATSQADAVMWLTMGPHAVSLDYQTQGLKHPYNAGAPGVVGGLPGNSWLALAFGGRAFSMTRGLVSTGVRLGLANALRQAQAVNPLAAGLVEQRLALIENDVLPALGPFSFSIGGTSPLAFTAGLQLKPGSLAAANRLLAMLRALAARNPALQLSGSATNFSVQLPTGSRLSVAEPGGKVVLTYGFPDQQAFLHPSATLSGNPLYRSAVAQLPAGSTPAAYLSFAPLASLVQLFDHKPDAAKAVSVLHKLSYFIVGASGAHQRVVLGLN